ncbi:MAG: sulfatase [Planctomycetota bacterium]
MPSRTGSPMSCLRPRAVLAVMLLAALFPALLFARGAPPSPLQAGQPGKRPNILFIAVDDLRPELGCYGNTYVKSPSIDRLAKEGVVFTRAYCQQAACNQSRASLLTGLRPDTLRVWDLKTDFRTNMSDAVTLPQYFKSQGYHAANIGKIFHNTIPDPLSWSEPDLHIDGYPFDPDAVYLNPENIALQEQRKQEIIEQGLQERYVDRFGKWYLKTMATEIADAPDNAYYDGAQTDVAIEKLRELKERGQPFFFAIGYYRPHLPFNVPRKYWDLYEREKIPLAANPFVPKGAPLMAINTLRELRSYTDFKEAPHPAQGSLTEAEQRLLKHGYLASVSYVDTQIGRLLGALDTLGLRKETIIVLWGDHGWKLGEHNSWCKMTNYEVDTRAPLIISAPGVPANGRRCDRLVEFVDIYPTLCELAGLGVPSGLEGTSAAALLQDPRRPWKSAAFTQFLREGQWVAPDGIVYMGYAIRTERHRYVEWFRWEAKELAARELYDLETDPQENVNVVEDPANAALVTELAARLKAGWRAARPPGAAVLPR